MSSSSSKKKFAVQKRKAITNATFNILREKIINVRPRCDNKPPKLSPHVVLKQTQKREDFEISVQRVKDNLNLIGKINKIARSHGFTDNYNAKLDRKPIIKPRLVEEEFLIDRYEKANFELAKKCICTRGVLPTTAHLLKDWEKNLKKIKSKAKQPIVLKELLQDELHKEMYSNPRRPVVYFNLRLKGEDKDLGRMEIVLFYDVVPNMVLNFIALCGNRKFHPSKYEKKYVAQPSLVGTSFYRIFPGLYMEGGDMIHGSGCGGMAADGVDFYPDNFKIKHHRRGTLAMIPNAEGKINSRFTISFKSLKCLNGRRPAFGRVIKGLSLLPFIQSIGSKNGKPRREVIISDCGLY